MLAELSFPHASYPVQDVRMFTYLVYFSAYCVPITHVRQRQEVQRLNASVNSSCAQPPLATAGNLSDLSVPGVGHLQILHCPGAGHLPTPGPFVSFWHSRSFLSEYNYTAFTGKNADQLTCQGRKKLKRVVKACSRFYACISSLLIKPELHSENRS